MADTLRLSVVDEGIRMLPGVRLPRSPVFPSSFATIQYKSHSRGVCAQGSAARGLRLPFQPCLGADGEKRTN